MTKRYTSKEIKEFMDTSTPTENDQEICRQIIGQLQNELKASTMASMKLMTKYGKQIETLQAKLNKLETHNMKKCEKGQTCFDCKKRDVCFVYKKQKNILSQWFDHTQSDKEQAEETIRCLIAKHCRNFESC